MNTNGKNRYVIVSALGLALALSLIKIVYKLLVSSFFSGLELGLTSHVNGMSLYRSRKFWSLLVWTTIVMAGVFSLFNYLAAHACDPVPISTLVVGKDRIIEITGAECWEISRSVYYEVKENGNVVTPLSAMTFDSGSDEHRYAILSAKEGSLVGVVDTTHTPLELAILHDFGSGESWPRLKDDEVSYDAAVRKKWRELFDQLQHENPELSRPEYFNVEW